MKTETITFRTTPELKQSLISESESRNISLSDLINERLSVRQNVRQQPLQENVRQEKKPDVRHPEVKGFVRTDNPEVGVLRKDIADMVSRQKSKQKPQEVKITGKRAE